VHRKEKEVDHQEEGWETKGEEVDMSSLHCELCGLYDDV